jgi:uncharacterized protein YjdB
MPTPGPYVDYLKPYIDQVWTKYANEDLIFNAGDAGVFKGRIVNGRLTLLCTGGGFNGRTGIVSAKPTTQEVLEGKGVFNQSVGDTPVDLAVQAQMTAALNRHAINVTTPNVGQQDLSNSANYYLTAPTNYYSKFWHLPGVSIDQLSYGFAYDDVFNYSSSLVAPGATKAIAVFGGYAGIATDVQAPTAPTNLASPSKSSVSVNLAWTTSTDNIGVTGYEVYVNAENTPRTIVTTNAATIGSLTANTAYTFKVRAKDAAGNFSGYSNTLSVTTTTTSTSQAIPGKIEAESYTAMSGVQLEATSDNGGGQNVGYVDAGDWMDYAVNVSVAGTYSVACRVASQPGGGQFQIRNSAGTSLASLTIAATGGWQTWTTLNTSVTLPVGIQTLRVYAVSAGWNINWIQFTGSTNVAVTGITVSPTSTTLNVGATQQLTTTISPSNATNKMVAWSSSNTAIVSVNASGLVTGVAAGNAVITVTTQDGNKTATSAITVTQPTSANLARNKPAFGLCNESAGTPPSAAVDGNANTRWSSCASDPQWMYVDLGGTYNITRVKISWETALGKDYQIQVSPNTTTWTTIKTITGNTTLTNDLTNLSGSGRYVRMYGTARGTGYGYSIWELEIYGTSGPSNVAPAANAGTDKTITLPTNNVVINGTASDSDGTISSYTWSRVSGPNTPTLTNANTANLTASGLIAGTYTFRITVTDNVGLTASDEVNVIVNPATTATNLALNKTIAVSSIENAGTPGSAAVDGNATTRWSSAFSDPQWIYVDLGANYNLNRVKVTWEGAFGKDYQIQTATTAGGPWTTIKTVTGNTTLVNDNTALSGTGRFVRINGTARGTGYGYSIYELEVYGTAAARMATENVSTEPTNKIIRSYPNPATDTYHLDNVNDGTFITIRSITGKESLQTKIESGSIDISILPAGVYIVEFHDGKNTVKNKLIKN